MSLKDIKTSLNTITSGLLISASLLGLFSCQPKAQESCGYVQNIYGERITWKTKEKIPLVIAQNVPVELRPAIYRAAQTWENRIGRSVFAITEDATQASNLPSKDGKNAIYYLTSWESNKHSEQGRTSVYWGGDQIAEADIRINGYDFSYYDQDKDQVVKGYGVVSTYSTTTAFSFEALVLHEMGHFLGLKHTDRHDSVMVTHLAAFTDRTEPSHEDIQDVKCMY